MTAGVPQPLGMATAAVTEGFGGFSASTAMPLSADVAAFQRIARDVQEEMMVAMLGSLQHCASVCAEIAIAKLNHLHFQMQKAAEEERLSRQQPWQPTEVSCDASSLWFGDDVIDAKEENEDVVETGEEDMGGSVESYRMYEDSSDDDESADVESSQDGLFRATTLIDLSEDVDDDAASFDGFASSVGDRCIQESDSGADVLQGDVSTTASTDVSMVPSHQDVDSEVIESICISREEWGRLMRAFSEELMRPATQKYLQRLKRSRPNQFTEGMWGDWLAFQAEEESIRHVAELRASGARELQWLPTVQEFKLSTLEKKMREIKGGAFCKDRFKSMYQSGLQYFCDATDMLSALAYQDLLMVHGPFKSISLDSLEVAWALRLYPTQVTQLAAGNQDFANLAALRRRINETIERSNKDISPPCPGRAQGALNAPSGGMADLLQRSEENLIGIGYRTIELLNLQEIIEHCAARLFRKDRNSCKNLHKALIIAGACGAEALHRELKIMPVDTPLPKNAAKCRLNASLQNMQMSPLSPEANLTLRAKAREYMAKECLVQNGVTPVLITAPHNIVLVRDGKPPHRMEESTWLIADRMAARMKGSCLAWSRREQFRTELHWAMAKRREVHRLPGNQAGLLDAENQDPNFLETSEVQENEWFRKMKFARERMDSGRRGSNKLLHVDVHGCRGPPHSAAHLNIGLGAMRQYRMSQGIDDPKELRDFGCALEKGVSEVIEGLNLEPRELAVCVIVPEDPEDPPALCGAWRPSTKRNSQTQQAMLYAGFQHACQLEMSLALRRALSNNKEALRQLSDCLWSAYVGYTSREGYRD